MADEEWMDPSEGTRCGTDPLTQRIQSYDSSLRELEKKLRYGRLESIFYGGLFCAGLGAFTNIILQKYVGETVELHNNQNYVLLSIGAIIGGYLGNKIWKKNISSKEYKLKYIIEQRNQARKSRLGRKNETKW